MAAKAYTLPSGEKDTATALGVFELCKKDNPAAAFIIFRSQNTNTVVYSADEKDVVTVEWHE